MRAPRQGGGARQQGGVARGVDPQVRLLTDDFTVENGYLTPSLKVKRDLVLRDYANQVEELYRDTRDNGNH